MSLDKSSLKKTSEIKLSEWSKKGAQGRDDHSAWLDFKGTLTWECGLLSRTYIRTRTRTKPISPLAQDIEQVKGETDAWKWFSGNGVGS